MTCRYYREKDVKILGMLSPEGGGMKDLLLLAAAVLTAIAAFFVLRKRVDSDCPV